MKIVRPEQPITREPLKEEKEEKEENLIIDDNNNTEKEKEKTIENLMNEIIKDNNKVNITISLTKRQYELYTQKGGICWLKKALVGQVRTKKKKSSKK